MNMKKSVLKATALVFVLSLFAKLIAFVKSIIQASYYGTNIETDAFNVANGFVSNILYMITTAIAVALVPIYIQRKINNDKNNFATKTITGLTVVSIIITGILIIIAPYISIVIAPSYSENELIMTTQYLRVLVLGFTFALITQLYSNLLNAEKAYAFSTFCSIINSLVLIAFILLFASAWGIWALVISVPVSYAIQWLILYLKGRKYAKLSFKYGVWDDQVKFLVIQAVPILLGQATVEINQVVDRALLTSIGAGALTAVSYAAILYQFATTLISLPISTVMFTELSEAGANKDEEKIKFYLNSSYKLFFLTCIPITVVIFFAAKDIVTFVYGYGNFSGDSILNCATGLAFYGFCLLPACIKSVLSRAYYAVNDTKRPMVIGVFEVILNIGLSILFVKPFGIIGVVGATAIATFVFLIVLIIDFNRKYVVVTMDIIVSYWKIILASVLLVFAMIITNNIMIESAIISFLMKTIIAFIAFYLCLLALKEETFIGVINQGKQYIISKIRST